MLHSGGKDTSICKGRKLFFSQAHDVYTHHQETTKQTPAPRLLCDTFVTLFMLLVAEACISIQDKTLI